MTAPDDRGWLGRLAGYVVRHRRNLVPALLGAVLGSACQTAVPLVERHIVDQVVVARTGSPWPWLALLLVVAAGAFGFSYLRRYRGGQVALGVQYDLRNAMHEHLQMLDFAQLDRMPTGQLVARANSDSALVQGLLSLLPVMSGNVLLLLASLAVMLVLSPVLAVVGLVVLPALLGVSYAMRRRTFPATWDGQQREGDVAQIVDEDVNGVRVVKAFGQERHELQRVADASVRVYGAQLRAVRLQARYQPLLQAIPTLGQVAVLGFGGWMALRHEITIGTFLAFSTYLGQLLAPARQLAGVLTIAQQARAGVERIFQLLDLRPAITPPGGAAALGEVRGELEFRAVTFGYGDGDPVLRDLDLRITAGERVALVGPSGGGKSTVTLLVPRFHDPGSGAVYLDGRDLRELDPDALRRRVGVVFEESFLFSDTVRANIAYGRPDATDAEVEAAARAARAHDFVTALPHGYDTVVGERGLTLSGGQRQRIALARVLLYDPAVLVLDDATSAVDATTEAEIHRSLRTALRGRTTLLVAHRRSTLHLADRIVVLDGGRVVEQGGHEELLARSPFYRQLLTGLDTERSGGDAIEVLADGVTAAAWERGGGHEPATGVVRPIGAPSIGAGLGGGGGSSWRLSLAPTPELLARVAALPPVRDAPVLDLDAQARPDPEFSLPRLLREFSGQLLLGLLLVVLDALASLAGPVLVRHGIDDGVVAGAGAAVLLASGLYLAVTLADLVAQIGETFLTGRLAQRVMLSLRIRIWAQLQRLSLDHYEREMAGRIMTRMTTDVDQFESLIQNGLLSALVSAVSFVGVGVALVAFDARLGLLTLSVVVPLAVATVVFRRRAARLYDLSRDRIAVVNADFQESLSGVREAQAFAHRDATVRRFRRLGRDYLESRVAAQRLVATYFPFVQFMAVVADAIVLTAGARLIAEGRLTLGVLLAFILYLDLFFSPIQQLSQVFDAWQQTRVSIARIAELMGRRTATPDSATPLPLGRPRGELELDGVRFAYPSRPEPAAGPRGPRDTRPADPAETAVARPPEALRGVSLRIPAGATVAVVGETGAGKSTVMKLLARFYDPDAGSVRVDGHDLRDLELCGYRRLLGYVPQEAFLFTGSIRDNIAYGRPAATDAEVEAAARAVGAHEFVAALPGGYHQVLAERGRSLSAGQRQLIALARAELVDPVVLLLDEATSNLDLATEARVTAAMRRLARGRTTVVIAHRLQTARRADHIVVLHAGRVAEQGDHERLLAVGGRYAAMWAAFELVGAT